MNDEFEFKKANNLREVKPSDRCAYCVSFYYTDAYAVCSMAGGPIWNREFVNQFFHVCDKFGSMDT